MSAENLLNPELIPETLDAGPITLRRWTVDRADDLHAAINQSLPELMAFMPWATADHDLEATAGYLVQSHGEWEAARTSTSPCSRRAATSSAGAA